MFEQTLADRSASEIVASVRAKEFVFVRRGYDQDQVRQFLVDTAAAIERLEEKRVQAQRDQDELRAEVELLRSELERVGSGIPGDGDPFEQTGLRVAEILRSVNAEAAAIRRQAEEAGEQTKREARTEAQALLREAEQARERARSEARSQAQALLRDAMEELASGGDGLLQELEETRRRVSGVLDELRTSIDEKEATIAPVPQDETAAESSEPETHEHEPAAPAEPGRGHVDVEPIPVALAPEPAAESVPADREPEHVEPEHVESEHVGPEPVDDGPAYTAPVHAVPVAAEAEHADAEEVEPEEVEPEEVEPEEVEPEQTGSRYADWMYQQSAESANGDSASDDPSNDESDHAEAVDGEEEEGDPDQNGNGREPILSFVFGSGPDATPVTPPSESPQTDAEPSA